MENPYQPSAHQPAAGYHNSGRQVQGPALALIITSLIAVITGILALAIDGVLLASGAVEQMEAANRGPISEYTQLAIRTVWGIVLILASSFVFYGALQMRSLKNYEISRAAAVVAMIPLVGPCCLLGIPFGIWAFVVLGKPEVRQAFYS